MYSFWCLMTVFSVCGAQQLLDLKTFKGGADTKIDATGPYSIYVSASSDSIDTLKQVYVKTSDNQIKSLYDLKNNKKDQSSGLLRPFQVNNEAFVSTTLDDSQMAALRGFLYVTTAQQFANTDGFYVYDVTVSEKIQFGPIQPDNCTLVFLNSNFDTNPWHSSTISSWAQEEGSSVYIYEGIPKDNVENKFSHIFSNPVNTPKNESVFIPTVEKFSLSLGSFYLKSYKGVNFVIEPSYTSIDGSSTSAETTTGFYMKPFNSPDATVTVLTLRDERFNGTTGANLIGNAPANSFVALSVNDGDLVSGTAMTPYTLSQGWSASTIGRNLTISSTNSMAGEFFVQYFVIQGVQVSSTTLPGRQTTAGPFETTTKSAGTFQFLTSILIPVIGARFL